MITSFHHVGCLVASLEEAIEDYRILHPGGTVSDILDVTDQKVKVCFYQIGALYVEFVTPYDEKSALYKLLLKKPGFYHIGLFCDDIDAEINRLEAEGYRKINKFRSPAFGNRFCSFLYNRQMQLIELMEAE